MRTKWQTHVLGHGCKQIPLMNKHQSKLKYSNYLSSSIELHRTSHQVLLQYCEILVSSENLPPSSILTPTYQWTNMRFEYIKSNS
mmetsp:Transcript_16479/g.28886  ORF Transcript_16479/g.28886 Transcript_16479/m.28886 type:complete len:85 (-) Transcript_16479:219-473(-)